MHQTIRVICLTIPMSLIHIASYLGVATAAFWSMGAAGVESSQTGGRYLLEWTPFGDFVPYTATAWGIISICLAIVAYISKPLNYLRDDDSFVANLVTMLTMLLTARLFTAAIILYGIMSSPVLLLLAFSLGWELLMPIAAFLILVVQNFINIPFEDLKDL